MCYSGDFNYSVHHSSKCHSAFCQSIKCHSASLNYSVPHFPKCHSDFCLLLSVILAISIILCFILTNVNLLSVSLVRDITLVSIILCIFLTIAVHLNAIRLNVVAPFFAIVRTLPSVENYERPPRLKKTSCET